MLFSSELQINISGSPAPDQVNISAMQLVKHITIYLNFPWLKINFEQSRTFIIRNTRDVGNKVKF